MAFENSDNSGLNNGRKLRLDISNINQNGLKGDTVYTDEALLQLIIDNISNIKVPETTQDYNQDGKVDVNDLIFNVSESFKRYANTQSDKITLPNLIEALTNGVSVLHSDLAIQKKVAEGLQIKLNETNRKEQGEKNPLIYSSGLKTRDVLHPIADIVRATEKEFVEQKNITSNTTNLAKAISNQPADLQSPIVEYTKHPEPNPRTLAETVSNLWILVDDLRRAVRSVVYDLDSAMNLSRMGDLKTFFTFGSTCVSILSTAKSLDKNHPGAIPIWNETSTVFDPNVPAYTQSTATASTECLNHTWYVIIGMQGGVIAQYSKSTPHWRNVATACPAQKAEYTNPGLAAVDNL